MIFSISFTCITLFECLLSGVKTLQNVIMYSAEAFIKCTNDKIKRMEASVNHLEDSSKKLAQHNKQLKKQLGVSH